MLGEPEPPISGRPDGLATSAHGAETHHTAQPARRPRARSRADANPSLAACAQSAGDRRQCHYHRAGASSSSSAGRARGRQRAGSRRRVRCRRTRSSTSRRAPASWTSPTCSARRRDRRASARLRRRRVRAQGALGAQGRRISFPKRASVRGRGGDDRRRQGGAAPAHRSRGPDVGADRRAAAGERHSRRQHQGRSAAKAAFCPTAITSTAASRASR